jgi:hypothetical protein
MWGNNVETRASFDILEQEDSHFVAKVGNAKLSLLQEPDFAP